MANGGQQVPGEDEDPREESIKVCCRFRPLNDLERRETSRTCVEVAAPDAASTTVYVPTTDHTFVFDRVFRWDASQKEVYDYAAKPIINAVLRGFNGTVFAYGQTSSGKTYTMEGPDIEDKVYQGVIPRMVWSIFDGIYHAEEHIEFLVKVSIVEIYNERIRDLLDPKKDSLKVHEDKARGVFIGEVTESYVGCEQEIFDAMRVGRYSRSMAVTNMNEHSSRSHMIFMLTVEQKDLHDRSVKVGKLHLVDLAGSEKVGKSGVTGERLDEAKHINRSLSALGNVINALTDKKYTHVPYRDSKLTRVLQESLGGNAKTSLIITCSPSVSNEQETISTLRFGQRAKMIKNVVKVNHERSAEELKILLDRREQVILELRSRISTLEQLCRSRGVPVPDAMQPSGAVSAAAATAQASVRQEELLAQLEDSKAELREAAERQNEMERDRDEAARQIRASEEERQRLVDHLTDAQRDKERIEHERNERSDEVAFLRQERQRLLTEIQELQECNGGIVSDRRNSFGEAVGDASSVASASRRVSFAMAQEVKDMGREVEDPRNAKLEQDRPLKRKVSQLDKNLEQLTVMYHKLVAQNSGLKVEVHESDKKAQRKDQRIELLERNLREAKQKYEKLLTQCANLTAAMDVMGRSKAGGFLGAAAGATAMRRHNIVRPVRGGIAMRSDGIEEAVEETPVGSEKSAPRLSLQPAVAVAQQQSLQQSSHSSLADAASPTGAPQQREVPSREASGYVTAPGTISAPLNADAYRRSVAAAREAVESRRRPVAMAGRT
eukprot:TRINITY_DN912_c0_g2_i1.p1 TRINITY_DN912_c0_g2~~TRINITY_DN912_c0_g2_i1.p1  ORF type:complete len:781 (+),score=184.31 TRINITY_DN912_c0_g2_i1:187-2529(+)